jgi:hypothetical protein
MKYVYADLCVNEDDELVAVPVEPLPKNVFAAVPVADHVLAVWTWDDVPRA